MKVLTPFPTTGVSARGGQVTYGNAYSGTQNTGRWGQFTGPGGQTTSTAKVGNNYYASHDGNVYKNTGSGWQRYNNGNWNDIQDRQQTQSLDSQAQARQWGDQRSASSSWGGNWGGGSSGSSWGGGSRSWGGGSSGGGGWDRGTWGGGGGGRSWCGGGFGGGGFRR